MTLPIPRTPWPANFPDVIVHSDLKTRDADPDFTAAKSGDPVAAYRLAYRLIDRHRLVGFPFGGDDGGTLLAVSALESTGYNAIPEAMASVMALHVSIPRLVGEVYQSNKVRHTRSSGWHRLATPARFEGPVQNGRDYILVDDHVGFGGTLADLRGHVEAQGGRVIAMTTLSQTREAQTIAVRPETLNVLNTAHGQVLEHFWQDHFGYGLDGLTNIEAGFLARQPSFDVIRDGLAEAAEQARRDGLSAVTIQDGG
jgi:hypothetical protein